MSEKKHLFTYPGEEVDVTWDRRLCIHIGECGRAKNDLFVGGRDPWCQPDLVDQADVLDVVERCPTGALAAHPKRADAPVETAEGRNTVVVTNNGPLYLRGALAIDGAPDDAPGLAFRAALCCCGASSRKPFCDNSHEKVDFRDRGAVGEPVPGLGEETGALKVKRAKNGPLLLKGPFEILAASGRVAWRGTSAALCRCGASGNKPFCDGSHSKDGFEAD